MRTFSFGGGVQSTAVLVLAAQGRVSYDAFLFANVGDDSENPATLEYMHKYTVPFANEYGLNLLELRRVLRGGRKRTLLQELHEVEKSIGIPVRMANGAPGRRKCTDRYKIRVVGKWQKQHGATPDNPAVTGLGISMDELTRMRTHSAVPWQTLEYPLIDLGMGRADCLAVIREAGLPEPPKSSCWFCPFKNRRTWQEMRESQPELYRQAVELEAMLNRKRAALGRDPVFFHGAAVTLDQATKPAPAVEIDDTCDSGFCFT